MEKYKVITLCGSVRFKEYFMEATKALSLQKYIVLPLGTYGEVEDKISLDELRDIHFQRIDMSDAIYVIDKDRYVGKSTREEIEYAKSHDKKVFYMSQHFRHEIKDNEWKDDNYLVSDTGFDQITIELTKLCMNNCIYCSSCAGHMEYECLNKNIVIEVIEDAISLGVKTICLSGGEPFLYNDLECILDYLDKSHHEDIEIIIYTSGIWSYRAGFARDIIEGGYSISKVVFDLPSLNLDTYNKLTGNLEKSSALIDVMQNLYFTLVKLGSEKVEINFVPNSLNMTEIYEIIQFAKLLNIRINFLALVCQGRASYSANRSKLQLDKSEFDNIRNYLFDELKEYPNIRIGKPLQRKDSNCMCNFYRRLTVQPNGNVTFCEAMKYLYQPIIANVNNKRLKDIVTTDFMGYAKTLIAGIECVDTKCPIQEIVYNNN